MVWKSKKPVSLPDAELAVLKVLWSRGSATIREITEVLYPSGATSDYATVQKLLDRLQTRGCVSRRREGRANVYEATIDRGHLIRESLRDAAEKLCGGSFTPLLTQLVDPTHLSPDDIRALRDLVDALDRDGHSKEGEG
jgi:predicted transcriptional regulator